jgi:hypothetical protein
VAEDTRIRREKRALEAKLLKQQREEVMMNKAKII